MDTLLTRLIFLAGLGQLSVLLASALVPFRLNWREELRGLSRLHRQMYWVYGGYIMLSIVAFAALSMAYPRGTGGWDRPGARVLRVCRGVLGHPPCAARRLRRQGTSDGLVAQAWLRVADGDVRRIYDHLRLGGLAVEHRSSHVRDDR